MYKINSINKFNMSIFHSSHDRWSKYIDLNAIFWKHIFDKNYFCDFLDKKYNKKNDKVKFLIKKLDYVIDKLSMKDNKMISPQDIIFSYRIMSDMLKIYNEYYTKKYNIRISLNRWFEVLNDDNIVRCSEIIEQSWLINKILDDIKFPDDHTVIKIFWPHEMPLLVLVWKRINKKNKLILDSTTSNEQFDYSSLVPILNDNKKIFNYLDYVLLYNDYWKTLDELLIKIENNEEIKGIKNVLYYDKELDKIIFENPDVSYDWLFERFTKYYHKKTNITKLFGKNHIYLRLLPYKCYWARCHFCTINTTNLYINKWDFKKYIDEFIEFIKKEKIYYIFLTDEAINPWTLIYFANKIIENKIEIRYKIRTRFSSMFDDKVCKLLYKSWLRYVGIWLESAVDKVNKIINKWYDEIPLDMKKTIINNFDKNGISFHNYMIFGLPWETDKDRLITYKFLINMIRDTNHFTCTPNIYWLMKWSYIYNNLDEFNLKILTKNYKEQFWLITSIWNLLYDWKKVHTKFIDSIVYNVNKEQFIPWYENEDMIETDYFWRFIDRSNFFYYFKTEYSKNPFRQVYNKILELNTITDIQKILKNKFKISEYWELSIDEKNVYIDNRILYKKLELPLSFKSFIENYDDKITLEKNIKNLWIYKVNNYDKYILQLVQHMILVDVK